MWENNGMWFLWSRFGGSSSGLNTAPLCFSSPPPFYCAHVHTVVVHSLRTHSLGKDERADRDIRGNMSIVTRHVCCGNLSDLVLHASMCACGCVCAYVCLCVCAGAYVPLVLWGMFGYICINLNIFLYTKQLLRAMMIQPCIVHSDFGMTIQPSSFAPIWALFVYSHCRSPIDARDENAVE